MQYYQNKTALGTEVTASPEIKQLKSLLLRGDIKMISQQSGFSPSHIGAVFRGYSHNRDIIAAIKKFIRDHKRVPVQKEVREDNSRQLVEQLITENYRKLKRCARHLTRNDGEADDLLQEAVELLLTKNLYRHNPGRYRGKYKGASDPFITFVYTVLHNLLRNNKFKRRKIYYTDELFEPAHFSAANAAESDLVLAMIDAEIAKATPTLQTVLFQLQQNANVSTTAKEAGMSVPMVRQYWAQVGVPFQKQLQQALELNPAQFPVRQTI